MRTEKLERREGRILLLLLWTYSVSLLPFHFLFLMESAFGLRGTVPSSRPGIIAGHHGGRAMRTSDAGIMLVVQGVIGHVLGTNVFPNLFP